MKNKILSLALFTLLVIFTQSCDKIENNQQPIETLNFKEVDFDLNLSSFDNLNKKFNIPKNDIEKFVVNNFDKLLTMDSDLEINISSKKERNSFKINNISNSKNQSSHRGGATETNCTTCRSEKCVANVLKEAIGSGNRDVDITVRVKSTLGIQTGLEICYDTDVK